MNTLPKKSEIAYWWYDSIHEEKNTGKSILEWLDIGEPDCWACCRYDPNYNDIHEYLLKSNISTDRYRDNPQKYICKMWDDSTLERHHIIPSSRGGSDTPDNLCLLCPQCHIEAPHTTDVDFFWNWARRQQKKLVGEWINCVKEVSTLAGLDFNKDAEYIRQITLVLALQNHPLRQELNKHLHKLVSFHPFAESEALFRDELYHSLKIAPSLGWTVESLESSLREFCETSIRR